MPTESGIALITELHRAVHALGLRIAGEYDITQAEALVLTLLDPSGSAPLEDIHKAFLHRRSTLTNVLERLEKRGFVERTTDAEDRRRYHIKLTATGKKKARQILGLFSDVIERSAANRGELVAATSALSKIVNAASVELR